jgi:hypothetical protein
LDAGILKSFRIGRARRITVESIAALMAGADEAAKETA